MPDSSAGISLTVAMVCRAKYLCECIVDGSYGFVVPGSCAGVSLAVAMAFRTQSCASISGGS